MKPELILRSDALDILFENRNKQYGAYLLRRNYPLHLYAGIGAMVTLVAALWIYSLQRDNEVRTLGGPVIILTPDSIQLAPPPAEPTPPPPPPAAPPPPRASVAFNPPEIVPNDQVTSMPEQTDLANAVISNITTDGPAGEDITQPPVVQPAAPVMATPPVEEPPAILTTASVMPSFPGGTAALQRWLNRNLRPQDEQEPGQRIRVVVRFAVNTKGEIEQVMITQNGGEAFDREVLRVINKMPKWEPGQQDGRPVAVWFSIPVIFEMPEQ